MKDLAAIFAETAAREGSRPALVSPAGTISFADLHDRAEAFAARLAAKGIRKGDRVLVAAAVAPDLYAMLAGLWQIGAVAVFPEPAMGLRGLLHAVRSARPVAFAAAGSYRWLRLLPALWRLTSVTPGRTGRAARARLSPDDPALISFTSGSTGAPKAILRTHGFLLAQHAAVVPLLGEDREHVDLVAFPVFALVNLAIGRTTVLPFWRQAAQGEVTGAALAAWVAKTEATRLLLPPALVARLADYGAPEDVRHVFTGGGPAFPDVIDRLRSGHPELEVTCVYGSTEAEPIAQLDARNITEEDRVAMSKGAGLLAGTPEASVRLRIIDDEIQVAGAHVNRGYLDSSRDYDTKVRDGGEIWHRTGDAGRLDAGGRLWLLGRTGAAIRRRDEVLWPFAIETAARSWPGLHAAALVADGARAVLAVEGQAANLSLWRDRAPALGVDEVRMVKAIPMDRRHRSKVDYPALRKLLGLKPPT